MKGRRVFISYSHQDYPLVQTISSYVKDSNDLIWLDRNFVLPGDEWRNKIQKALKSSYCLIFFASTASVKSNEVKLEIDYALHLKKRVIPVLLEECKLPYEVSNLHHINLIGRSEQEVEVFRQVLSAISSKKKAKPAVNKTAVTIVDEVKTSNNFYNTLVVPNRFIWTSSVAGIFLLIFLSYLLIQQNSQTDDTIQMDAEPINGSIDQKSNPDTTQIKVEQERADKLDTMLYHDSN